MAKLIKAVFGAGQMSKTCPQWQYDYNTILQFVGLDLPSTFEVDLANSKTGQSTTVLGDADGCCTIPAQYFIPGTSIFAWAYIVDGNSGFTRCQVEIPIHPRAQHTGDPPTPEQQSALDQAIALLNAAAENIPNEINAALTEAKESGEFDGEKGDKGDKGDKGNKGDPGNGVWLVDVQYTRTIGAGVQAQLDHMVGRPGAIPAVGDLCVVSDGRFGSITSITPRVAVVPVLGDLSGTDGYSPTVTITEITGGHRVTITDETHPQGQSFDVMDGSGSSGSSDYNDLSNKPSIEGVTLSGNKTAAQLGLAKASDIPAVPVQSVNNKTGAVVLNASDVGAGTYSKPSGGIPKNDLASAVQSSLSKADTALQSAPVTSVNGQTGAVTVNVPTKTSDLTNDSGFVNAAGAAAAAPVSSVNGQTGSVVLSIPTVPSNVSAFANDAGYLTQHQDISGKLDKAQGAANAGKFLVVGNDGNITLQAMTSAETEAL